MLDGLAKDLRPQGNSKIHITVCLCFECGFAAMFSCQCVVAPIGQDDKVMAATVILLTIEVDREAPPRQSLIWLHEQRRRRALHDARRCLFLKSCR